MIIIEGGSHDVIQSINRRYYYIGALQNDESVDGRMDG